MGVNQIGIKRIGLKSPIMGARSGGAAVTLDGVPSNLVLTVDSDTQITATFESTSANQEGYRLYISTDGMTFTEKTTGTGLSLVASGLTANTLYYFYVVAYLGSIESTTTNTVDTSLLIDLVFSLKWDGSQFINAVTGTAMGDLQGYTLTLTANEITMPNFVSGATSAEPFAGMAGATESQSAQRAV